MSKRLIGRPFQPGVSGNPGGRPKILEEIKELARSYTTRCIERLNEIADNKKAPAQARVAANVALLDRAWGKPGQSVDMKLSPADDLDSVLEAIDGKNRSINDLKLPH